VERFDSVVIGAGPAGLSAAVELSSTETAGEDPGKRRSCLILEAGQAAPQRSRTRPRELLSGVGGAGLFSDGKHSFFPASSGLWALPDEAAKRRAFEHTAALLARFGVDAGALPEGSPSSTVASGVWQPKEYPSIYVSLADRFAMIDALWSGIRQRKLGARVVDAQRRGDEIELMIDHAGQHTSLATRHLIVATGRLSPRFIAPWLVQKLGVKFAFLRCEFGVRIETAADHPLFAKLPGVDGKLRFIDADRGLEFRTFCTCRDGEVVLGEAQAVCAFSGRADGPPSGRSNLGLLVRSTDAAFGREVAAALAVATPESLSLSDWQSRGAARLAPIFGARGAQAVTTARQRLEEFCPALAQLPGRVFAPSIEGVGEYPVCDDFLQAAPGVFIAGDAAGRFRGIVAAMISGRYVAQRILSRA
jgi:uncharacterized FAD-dependent dehydrogenase